MKYKLCKECGQPIKPGRHKKDEYEHARGCPLDRSKRQVKIRKDYEQRRWQVDQAGKRFLISPSTGGRIYEEALR